MSLLFIHDHIFIKNKDDYYSTGGLSGEALSQYVAVFGEVTIIARCRECEITNNLSYASIEGIKFVIVPNHKTLRKAYKIIEVNKVLREEVKKSSFVIARTSTLGYKAARYAKKYKKPLLVEVVGCAWDSLWNYGLRGKFFAPLSFFTQKKIVKNAQYVIYVTKYFLQNRYPTKGKSINCSNVNLEKVDIILSKRIDKINKQNEYKDFIIGTIGSIDVKYKGQEHVINALAHLKKQGITNIKYQLVGCGDNKYLDDIAKKHDVRNQISYLGVISHNKIYDWIDEIDLYIQPSLTEGLPRSIIEAMSRACPVIGSNAGGIPELIDKEMIYTKANAEELAIIIQNMTKENMIEHSELNFKHSKEYLKESLHKRRADFLIDFKTQS